METYSVTIMEISKCVVEIEAETFEEAKRKVEEDYWQHPLDYVVEPYDTFFE